MFSPCSSNFSCYMNQIVLQKGFYLFYSRRWKEFMYLYYHFSAKIHHLSKLKVVLPTPTRARFFSSSGTKFIYLFAVPIQTQANESIKFSIMERKSPSCVCMVRCLSYPMTSSPTNTEPRAIIWGISLRLEQKSRSLCVYDVPSLLPRLHCLQPCLPKQQLARIEPYDRSLHRRHQGSPQWETRRLRGWP